jgi:hypothetical protein
MKLHPILQSWYQNLILPYIILLSKYILLLFYKAKDLIMKFLSGNLKESG